MPLRADEFCLRGVPSSLMQRLRGEVESVEGSNIGCRGRWGRIVANDRIFHFEKLEIEGHCSRLQYNPGERMLGGFFLPGAVTRGDSDWFHCQECDIRVSWQK